MKKILIRNYRIIAHIFCFLELIFFFWIWGAHDFYTTPVGLLLTLIINYPIAEFSLKWSGLKDLFDKL